AKLGSAGLTNVSRLPGRDLTIRCCPLVEGQTGAAPMPSTRNWPPSQSNMAQGLRSHDWSDSTLGSPEHWPLRLRHAVESALEQKLPAAVAWGPELIVCAYNDSYQQLLGLGVEALGKPLIDLWQDCRERVEDGLRRSLAGEALLISEMPLDEGHRHPLPELIDFSLSPLRDDARSEEHT